MPTKHIAPEIVAKIVALYTVDKRSKTDIVKETGVTDHTLNRVLVDAGLAHVFEERERERREGKVRRLQELQQRREQREQREREQEQREREQFEQEERERIAATRVPIVIVLAPKPSPPKKWWQVRDLTEQEISECHRDANEYLRRRLAHPGKYRAGPAVLRQHKTEAQRERVKQARREFIARTKVPGYAPNDFD